jgi:hypothetical protein
MLWCFIYRSFLSPFCASTLAFFLAMIYTWSTVPESLDPQKRLQIMESSNSNLLENHSKETSYYSQVLKKVNCLEELSSLFPSRVTKSGTANRQNLALWSSVDHENKFYWGIS